MKIYGDIDSGNCLKVKWTADLLALNYDWIETEVLKGETRTPAFLAMSPQGQVPAVDFGDGRVLAQSNGIIRYLARGTALLPDDPFQQAKIDEWLFWEQNSHEFFVAGCRFQMVYLKRPKATRDPMHVERGEKALDLMNVHLTRRAWFSGETMTIADIALLAYTRVAHEGGFDLGTRPHVRAWIARCEAALKLQPA